MVLRVQCKVFVSAKIRDDSPQWPHDYLQAEGRRTHILSVTDPESQSAGIFHGCDISVEGLASNDMGEAQ